MEDTLSAKSNTQTTSKGGLAPGTGTTSTKHLGKQWFSHCEIIFQSLVILKHPFVW